MLKKLGVTYDQLRAKGMNVNVMKHFGFTMSQWLNLGMTEFHVQTLSDEECLCALDLPRDEILQIMGSYHF